MKLDRIILGTGGALLALSGLAACDKVAAPTERGDETTHPGGPGGAAPCAPSDFPGEHGAGIDQPEKFPLKAEADYGDFRWAVCGAGIVDSAELINLHSEDGGETYTVTDTGLSMLPFHAGDRVDVELHGDKTGSIHLLSRVAESDRTYTTDNGGLDWDLKTTCP